MPKTTQPTGTEIMNGLRLTEVQIWPVRNPEGSRIKAMASITFNDCIRVNGCKIIEGAKGLFLSYPSEKKPGSDQWFPLFHVINRQAGEAIQDAVLKRFNDLVA